MKSNTIKLGGLGGLTIDVSKAIYLKIFLVLGLSLFGGFFSASAYLIITFWCLQNVRKAIEGLSLAWLLTMLNPGIFSLSTEAGILRWLPIFASWLTILRLAFFHNKRVQVSKTVTWLGIYATVMILVSLFSSQIVEVSVFKIISFFLGTSIILIAFELEKENKAYWNLWFIALFKSTLYLSIPFLFLGVGYFINGVGFQGILDHPQTFGPVVAFLLGWYIAVEYPRQNTPIFFWITVIIGIISVLASQSRTAILVPVGGLFIAMIIALLKTGLKSIGLTKKRFIGVMIAVGMALIYFIINFNIVTDTVNDFLIKRGQDSFEQSFEESRGFLIEQSMNNFYENPYMGIGFGLSSEPSTMNISRDPLFGLPIGATAEKGFLPSAILEETGIIGAILFIIVLASVFRSILSKEEIFAPLFIVIGAILLNVGEATLLSIGGNGLLLWLLIGYTRLE